MGVRPKKRLGQHFLVDAGIVQLIAEAVQAPADGRVVEIGPGEGVLTAALLPRFPGLVAVEVDPEAVAYLRRRFPALDLREADVLDIDWSALRASPSAPPLTVVGNLPYYITSPILFALLDARAHVGQVVVMVQREVAERLAAPHGSKVYGTLSVYFQLYARTRVLFDVPRLAFRPPPAVESAVVEIDFGAGPPPACDPAALRRVVRAAFGQRRKMFRNSVAPVFADVGRALPAWAETLRPEAVAPDDFVKLAQALTDSDAILVDP